MEERLGALEGAVKALGQDDFVGAKTTGAGHVGAGSSEQGADGGEDGASGRNAGPQRPLTRREYLDLVTLEPADEDEEVFGDAWAAHRPVAGAHAAVVVVV